MSTEQTHDLLAEIEDLPELLPLPDTALTLLSACKDANVGAREISRIVSCDASLSVRLLRVSNSTLYGLGGQIKTVEHAAVVLGVRGLRDLAMAIVATGLFQDGEVNNPSVGSLWKHSLGCATVARVIAQSVDDVCPDEAFVSGIIHDVGKLVLIQLLEEQYDLIPRALQGESTIGIEQELYGIDHAELGERCAEEWGLPFEIGEALLNHHATCDLVFPSRLSTVIVAANQFSKVWKIGTSADVEREPMEISEETNLPFDELELSEVQRQSEVDFVQNQIAFQD